MRKCDGMMMFQRRMLGVLCALLPFTSIIFGLAGGNLPYWYCSISATYYANSRICMIGLLFATAVFFYSYGGHDWRDRVMSLVQATASLGVIAFPCETEGVAGSVGLFSLPVGVSHIVHCISASVLFLAFATNIMFLFTRGDASNPMKARRNVLYRICGGIIYLFALIQALTAISSIPEWFPMTLINETVMLEAFALAWLVKSGLIMEDK